MAPEPCRVHLTPRVPECAACEAWCLWCWETAERVPMDDPGMKEIEDAIRAEHARILAGEPFIVADEVDLKDDTDRD